jgi:hypothetical protein
MEFVASQPSFTQASVNTLTPDINVSDEEDITIDILMDDIKPAIDSSLNES